MPLMESWDEWVLDKVWSSINPTLEINEVFTKIPQHAKTLLVNTDKSLLWQ